MKDVYAYEREPYQTELETEVLMTGEDGARPYAVLRDTICFPEGGGQPSDRGLLGEAAVLDVQRVGGELRHYFDGPVEPGPVTLQLDWPRRYDHMQQHTAQHLLTAVTLARHGWKTTAFHLQEEVCDIELNTEQISDAELEALEDAVVAEIRASRAISARRVDAEELAGMKYRSRGLPEGHEGDVRLVTIDGIDVNTCGGTHLHSTSELETIKLLGTESIRRGTRLFWLAGGRVRRRLGRHEARNAELRRALDTGDDDLVEIARLRLAKLKDTTRRQRAVLGKLAEAVAENLAGRSETLVEEHFDDAEMGLLQQIGRRFNDASHPGLALLTARGEDGCFFVVAVGGASEADAQAAGGAAAEALGGRGGGSGKLFQGKVPSLSGRTAAREALARFLG